MSEFSQFVAVRDHAVRATPDSPGNRQHQAVKYRHLAVVPRNIGTAQRNDIGLGPMITWKASENAGRQTEIIVIGVILILPREHAQARRRKQEKADRTEQPNIVHAAPIAAHAKDPHAVDLLIALGPWPRCRSERGPDDPWMRARAPGRTRRTPRHLPLAGIHSSGTKDASRARSTPVKLQEYTWQAHCRYWRATRLVFDIVGQTRPSASLPCSGHHADSAHALRSFFIDCYNQQRPVSLCSMHGIFERRISG